MTRTDVAPPAPPTSLWPLALAGLVVILLIVGGFTTWSVAAPLSSAAVASGTVVVDSNRKVVQHLEGGTVKSILVKDGDRVTAGQLLIELDNVRQLTVLANLQPRAHVNAAVRARLMAERQGAEDIQFPRELLEATEKNQQSIVFDQQKLFAARRAALDSRRAVLVNQREQAEVLIAGLKRRIENQHQRLGFTQVELDNNIKLAERGHGPKQRVLELRRAMAELESEEADLQTKLGEARMQVQYSLLEIQRAENSFAEDVEIELQKVRQENYDLIKGVKDINEQLGRLKVTAPVSGTVVNRAVHTIGGVVAPGATLLEIVPGDDPLVIEARVETTDVEGLEVGMPVEIRFPGLTDKRLQRLHGELVNLSPDRLVDETGTWSYFAARVRVDDESLQAVGRENLRPGMPVNVMLVKRSRTVIGYLMDPLDDFVSRAMRE